MSWVRLGVALVVGAIVVVVLHAVCLHFYPKAELDVFGLSDFYPLSVFRFRRPAPYQLGLAGVLLLGFVATWRRLQGASLASVWGIALLLTVLSNGLHGLRFGLDYPTATNGAGGIEYFHDALVIPGPIWLLQHFNAIQPELLEHSRTHPPGPVLLYWLLLKLCRAPSLISVAIAALGLGLTLPPLAKLLRIAGERAPSGALLLFATLPAVSVYGLAVVDAPILGVFTYCVAEHVDEQRPFWLVGAWLFVASFFSFGALFLLPVLMGYEVLRGKWPKRTVAAIAMAASLLSSVRVAFGFDWLAAFLEASALENPDGFLLLANPKRYFWYRLGSVAEIALFFTPFLWILWRRGQALLRARSRDAWLLSWLGPASLAAVLLSGAFKIGEAARICLFILPYLFLPVAAAWQQLDDAGRARTAYSVLGFGLALQLFGFYQW